MSITNVQHIPWGFQLTITALGASLHDILTRLKAEPQRFPKLDLVYDPNCPALEPIILNLPPNGIRLRFDGPEQRLRLVEVLDFTKSHITYNDKDVLRPVASARQSTVQPATSTGPTFKHIYNTLFGPSFPGEYVQPEEGDETGMGLYILSYPGVAFSFPLAKSAFETGKDCVSLLSSTTSRPAVSMAVFSGPSWPEARDDIYTRSVDPRKYLSMISKSKEPVPEEVQLVKIHGGGRLELQRSGNVPPFWIKLGLTSPQELVAVLGPPDAIYRKNDQRLSIHKAAQPSRGYDNADAHDARLHDDSTDTDQSSAHTATDDSEDENEDGEVAGNVSGECFYNYFFHGFDVLLAAPTAPSRLPPSILKSGSQEMTTTESLIPVDASKRLVASKLILHGNVPGSYPFNRHRKCRWEIGYLKQKKEQEGVVNPETSYKAIEKRLHDEWKSIYKDEKEAKLRQRGMVLNRDWGDSPGSSCELLGGWEEEGLASGTGGKRPGADGSGDGEGTGLGNTTLYGFPGLVFEVLKNGTVSGLTVF